MKTVDPILAEIRAFRDALAEKYDYDIERIACALDEMHAQTGLPVESRPPKRRLAAKKAS